MPLRFTFRQLEYLVAVGSDGTIALAAQRMNVFSPSISAAISQLEAEFGVQIFVREHAQGLSLTPGGRRIYTAAKRILSDAGALTVHTHDVANTPHGPIAIGALSPLSPLMSASLRRSFTDPYPDVLVSLPPNAILPANHAAAGAQSLSLADLVDEPLVLPDLPLSWEYFLSLFHEAGSRPIAGERTARLAVAQSLVANGFGFAKRHTVAPIPREAEMECSKVSAFSRFAARQQSRLEASLCK